MNNGRWFLSLLLLLGFPFLMMAQDSMTYQINLKRELSYSALGLVSLGGGEYIRSKIKAISITALPSLDLPDIDEVGLNDNPALAGRWSDAMVYTAAGLNSLLLLSKESRQDFGQISVLLTETLLLNGGLTNLSKVIFRRPRPYVYDPNWAPGRLVKSTDRSSLVSGHTSGAAAASFFFARVFSDYHPQSKLRPYVWGIAATLPIVTGYLRVKANKHYPSDVLAGYCLGAAIGYLVPVLHKLPNNRQQWRLMTGQNQLGLRLVF